MSLCHSIQEASKPAQDRNSNPENERKENKKQQQKLKMTEADLEVRQELRELPSSKSVNKYYLEIVDRGEINKVRALFEIHESNPRNDFNPDAKDKHERLALRIGIDNHDAEMCDVLLSHKVEVGDCLFHAIKEKFFIGIETLLKHRQDLDKPIIGENCYFPVGMAPLVYAAHCNDYDAVKVLVESGHKLQKPKERTKKENPDGESANKRRMLIKARCSPAYITFTHEAKNGAKLPDGSPNGGNVLEYCIENIREVRKEADLEKKYSGFFEELERTLEDYMCSLLDQIRSFEEVKELFKNDPGSSSESLNGATPGSEIDYPKLVDKVSTDKLVKFITHDNVQSFLTSMLYSNVSFLQDASLLQRMFLSFMIAILFPILSIFYIIAPSSRPGRFMAHPAVSYLCHMMSDVTFIAIIIVNIITKPVQLDYLGSPPTILEWLILVWVLGKWVQEIKKCKFQSWQKYRLVKWNYNGLLQLPLFTVGFALRIVDFVSNDATPTKITRSQWSVYQPRLLSHVFFAWAYLYVFLGILNLLRANRVLGPLQVALARIVINIIQFLCIFGLVIFSFSMSLTELNWFYGTAAGRKLTCSVAHSATSTSQTSFNNQAGQNAASNAESTGNSTSISTSHSSFNRTSFSSSASATSSVGETCSNSGTLFINLGESLTSLFWALYGHIDVTEVTLNGEHQFTAVNNWILLGAYHVVAITVLINMLIAMMTKSYEITSNNEEIEWKFHRTSLWIRFIRREAVCPPPMNLIPSPYHIAGRFRYFLNFVKCSTCCRKSVQPKSSTQDDSRSCPDVINNPDCPIEMNDTSGNQQPNNILFKLVQRYKFSKLLNDYYGQK